MMTGMEATPTPTATETQPVAGVEAVSEKNKGGRPRKDPAELVGTVSGYVNHGLRDPETRAAWAKYMRERRGGD